MSGFQARPSKDKIVKWLLRINDALAKGTMTAGWMSKLAGGLSWGACALFKRMGRAALRLERSAFLFWGLGVCVACSGHYSLILMGTLPH